MSQSAFNQQMISIQNKYNNYRLKFNCTSSTKQLPSFVAFGVNKTVVQRDKHN